MEPYYEGLLYYGTKNGRCNVMLINKCKENMYKELSLLEPGCENNMAKLLIELLKDQIKLYDSLLNEDFVTDFIKNSAQNFVFVEYKDAVNYIKLLSSAQEEKTDNYEKMLKKLEFGNNEGRF